MDNIQIMSRSHSDFASLLAFILCVAFLLYVFVGVSPLTDGSTLVSGAGGSAEQVVAVLLSGLACWVITLRKQTARRVMVDCWPVFLPLVWFCASVTWAQYPEIALRRVGLLVLVNFICVGIAAGLDSLWRALCLLVGVLALVILADIAVTIAVPGFALTEIGVRGFHSQKNTAGLVGMTAVVAFIGWALSPRRPTYLGAGLLFAATAGTFLQMTMSKTSVMLGLIGVFILPTFLIIQRCSFPSRLFIVAMAFGLLGCMMTAITVLDIDASALLIPGNDPTFTGRSDIWNFVQSEIERRPWLGYGYGSFWDVGEVNDPLFRAPAGVWLSQHLNGFGSAGRINEAHNGYLDLRLQGGIPALLFATALLAYSIYRLLQKMSTLDNRNEIRASATFLTIILVSIVHNGTESSFWMRGQILGNLIIFILILALKRENLRTGSSPGPSRRTSW